MFHSLPFALTVAAKALALAALFLVALGLGYAVRARRESRAPEPEASTDPLTGLRNRRQLMEDLAAAVAQPLERGEAWLLVLFDLDGFKHYNETFGHPTGDTLLARLGDQLARSVTPGGRAYRLGGDEFCV